MRLAKMSEMEVIEKDFWYLKTDTNKDPSRDFRPCRFYDNTKASREKERESQSLKGGLKAIEIRWIDVQNTDWLSFFCVL